MKRHLLLPVLWCMMPSCLWASPSAVISQIMYDTPLNEQIIIPPYSNGEFIELYNISDSSLSLSGWSLCGDGKTEKYTFPANTTLDAGKHLIIAYRHKRTPDFTLSDLYGSAVSGKIILYQSTLVLSNSGESIILRDADGTVIDSIYYDGTSHKLKPDRLSAANQDSIAGSLCRSLQRTKVTYDSYGYATTNNSHWQTRLVSFGTNIPARTEYITSDFYWSATQTTPASDNYVISVTPLDENSSISFEGGKVRQENGKRAIVSVRYFDELNRPFQQTVKAASPERTDIVSYTEYDDNSRTIRTWQPVAADGTRPLSVTSVQSLAESQYSDDAPYQSTVKEKWSNGRTVRATTAGEAYQTHPATTSYLVNDAAIPRFTVTDNGFHADGEYAAGALRVTTTTDPDGKQASVFQDVMGRTVLIRQGTDHDTYYLYDDLGRLRYTLPPAVSQHLSSSSSFTDTDSLLRQFAYIYHYDKRGHVIRKHIPGAEDVYTVYDKAGRLVLQQNGNQRARGNYWTVLKYDSYGRLAYTAEVDTRSSDDLQDMVDSFSEWVVVERFSNSTQNHPMENTGYSRGYYHNRPTKLLTVNYYDTYDFLQLLPADTAAMLQYQTKSGYDSRHENTLGMLTGTRTYNLSDNRYTTTAYYYDAQGRVIQSRSTSIISGYNITYTAYNFDGSVRQTLSEQGNPESPMQEQYTYSYDHVGRPAQVLYAHSNEPAIRLSENIYDEHGQLSTRFRHNRADTTFYARDVRGALTASVNSRFSEHLFYGDSIPQGATACYNGNIAAATLTNGDSTLTFGYTYDAYNRLTESLHLQGNQARSSEYFQFDNMGNITRLQRHTLDNRLIDDLQFTYSGNQVSAITDYAGSLDRYDTKEYTDRSTSANTIEQRYDANGNLTVDLDRGIQRIRYNILNLPDTVFFSNGNRLINSYDAIGRKWQSQTVTLRESEVMPTDDGTVFDADMQDILFTLYDGSMEYQHPSSRSRRDSLLLCKHIIHNPEGYIEYSYQFRVNAKAVSTTTQIPPRALQVIQTQYYHHRDHLGNNCAVWDATNNSVAQRTWYYASGTPMSISTAQGVQPYKYNGKEYVEAHGYDTYDYGFRGYYATIGRFTSIDPLTERTPWQSPYAYANNNWVNLIDFMGLEGNSVYTTSDQAKITTLLKHLSGGGDLKSFDFDEEGWDACEIIDWGLTPDGVFLSVCSFMQGDITGGMEVGYMLPECVVTLIRTKAIVPSLMSIAEKMSKNTHSNITEPLLNLVGNTIGFYGNINCNELYWFGKNGNLYTINQRLKGSKGNYVYNRSYVLAKKRLRALKYAGNALTTITLIYEASSIIENRRVMPSNAINLFFGSISYTGVGALFAAGYYTADMIVTNVTGLGFGDMLDNKYGCWYEW